MAELLPEVEWRTSSFSAGGACVEVALLQDRVAVRDSKDRGGPMLLFSKAEWVEFLARVRNGDVDLRT